MAIAHDGCTGNSLDPPIIGLEALDHDLMLTDQRIDEQRRLDSIGINHHHDALCKIAGIRLQIEQFMQDDYRQIFPSDLNNARLITEQLAEELARVLDSAALQSTMRARGLARAQEFVWDRTARQTIAVYERLMA